MLVGDEFDLFAAQRMDKGDMRLLGAMEDIARRGRVKGIGLVAISQRPASIHKDVLSQLSVLIAHRLVGPHDRNAVDDWVAAHGTREERDELMSSIAALPPGEAWFWSPSWLQEFRRVAVLPSETFDSMATPKPGRRRLEPTVLSPVDIEALRDRLRGIVDVQRQRILWCCSAASVSSNANSTPPNCWGHLSSRSRRSHRRPDRREARRDRPRRLGR